MIDRERLIGEFMELVRVDSETRHEGAISETLKAKFGGLGLAWVEDTAGEKIGHGAGNLFVRLAASDPDCGAPRLFFTSHMDTVSPGRGIEPRLDADGYLRSSGSTILGADDKAGLAAMLEAVRVLQENRIPHGPVQFIVTVGEEMALAGSRAMDASLIDADFGFALDSDGPVGDIIVAAPAQAKIQIAFTGRAAHAGVNPEAGISAIQVASKAVARMPLGRIDSETTANIGRFSGGGPTNVVCETAELLAEARSLSEDKLERQLAAMREACEEAARSMEAQVDFQSRRTYPAYRFAASDRIVELAAAAIRRIGRTPRTLQSGGGSDANVINGFGVPTVNLAIGYEHIHTTREQLPVEELVKTAELVVALIREAAGS